MTQAPEPTKRAPSATSRVSGSVAPPMRFAGGGQLGAVDSQGPVERRGFPDSQSPAHHGPSISAVLNTLNEEHNIANAIKSVRSWVNEVIVMDMHSDDQTPQIARSLGAKVLSYPRVINFDAARVAAVELATSEWILLLDADEVIPLELSRHLLRLAAEGDADAYMIPRLNHFLGTPLLHGGAGPEQDRQLRFYRRGSVSLNDILHAHIQVKPGTRVVDLKYRPDACIIHFCYKDSTLFVSKLNKYTSLTAFQRKDSKRIRDRSLVLMPIFEFFNRYVRKSAYRSGWKGFYYAFMMAVYRMTQNVKIREHQACDDSGDPYQKIATEIVRQYESEADPR